MAETEKKASKKSWFKGLKAEFRKIIWVDNKTLGKQTVAVVAISAVTCGIITLVDSAVIEIVNLLIKLGERSQNVRSKLVCSPHLFGL